MMFTYLHMGNLKYAYVVRIYVYIYDVLSMHIDKVLKSSRLLKF